MYVFHKAVGVGLQYLEGIYFSDGLFVDDFDPYLDGG